MRPLRVGLGLFLVLLLGLAAALFLLNRYLQSPAFKQAVLRSAHDTLGADVQIGEIQVSLFSGVSLERVTVANPPGFPGDFLRADALRVRYRLLPLLRKRLEVQQVVLEAPALVLARGDHGEWNFEQLGPKAASGPPRPGVRAPSTPAAETPAPPSATSGLDVVLPKLAVERGRVVLTGGGPTPVARIEGLDLGASVSWTGGTLVGTGQTSLETLAVGDALFVRKLAAPLRFTRTQIKLAPLHGTVADGELSGDMTVDLARGLHYAIAVEVKNVDVQLLLRDAGARRQAVSGRLHARAQIEGAGGLATAAGKGRVELLSGRLADVPVLTTLELLLQIPGLRDLRLDECWVDFTLAGETLQTPALRIASRDVQITGQGTVSLVSLTLDHHLTLALPKQVVARAPREVRSAFAERPDGWQTVDFRVWGPYDAPRTDLSDRVLKGVTENFLKRGLRKLFK